jgi:hypothetical protein
MTEHGFGEFAVGGKIVAGTVRSMVIVSKVHTSPPDFIVSSV